jgi:hypothetical protein
MIFSNVLLTKNIKKERKVNMEDREKIYEERKECLLDKQKKLKKLSEEICQLQEVGVKAAEEFKNFMAKITEREDSEENL